MTGPAIRRGGVGEAPVGAGTPGTQTERRANAGTSGETHGCGGTQRTQAPALPLFLPYQRQEDSLFVSPGKEVSVLARGGIHPARTH